MKVLMLNGSRREKGCTYTALNIIAESLKSEGIDSEIIHIGLSAVNGEIDKTVEKIKQALTSSDGLIVGSPVYYAGASGEVTAVLDRLFSVAEKELRTKPGAAIASARRAGTTATVDALNKYFTFAEMPVVSSRYWNMVHGSTPEDVLKDEEGVQIMRILGRNFAWLLKCIEAGKKAGIPAPEQEKKVFTNFIK